MTIVNFGLADIYLPRFRGEYYLPLLRDKAPTAARLSRFFRFCSSACSGQRTKGLVVLGLILQGSPQSTQTPFATRCCHVLRRYFVCRLTWSAKHASHSLALYPAESGVLQRLQQRRLVKYHPLLNPTNLYINRRTYQQLPRNDRIAHQYHYRLSIVFRESGFGVAQYGV